MDRKGVKKIEEAYQWYKLMQEARNIGLTTEKARKFLAVNGEESKNDK